MTLIKQNEEASVEGVGGARAGNDDVYVWGRASQVFPAIENFLRRIRERCSLILEPSKTEVFTWSGRIPIQASPDILRGGMQVDMIFHPGFVCYGIQIGSDIYVKTS